ncbi:MAG: carboxypeptidase-like regulatory domain-containing protein, partial [Candidatus Hodarchaeota archaeon]
SCTLPKDGTYTILASDSYGDRTGDYCLYLQRLNNPGNKTNISFGETLCNTISDAALMDTYTFTAVADDKVLVSMTRTSGDLLPYIRVYDPDGIFLCEDWLGNPTAEIPSCTLPKDGTYTILASDSYGDRTGDYYLYLGCLNPPCSSGYGVIYGNVYFTGLPCNPSMMEIRVPPCDGPYPNYEVIVYDESGTQVVDSTFTDCSGKYIFSLPPGTYVIYSKTVRSDIPNTIQLDNGEQVELDIDIDTGIT